MLIFFIIFMAAIFYWGNKNNNKQVGLGCQDCNLIIISLTNTRKDHLGIYGYKRDTSSNIDNFFNDALVFDNAFSPSPWTLPSAASLMTSLFPWEHKVVNRYEENKLPQGIKTLPEILKKSGYLTAGFTGGGDYSRQYGFDRGFTLYRDEKDFSKLSYYKEDIIDWLEENYKNKFFLFLQGFDNHCPFNPSDQFKNKYTNSSSTLDMKSCFWNLDDSKENLVFTKISENKDITYKYLNEQDRQKLIDYYDGGITQMDNNIKEILETISSLRLEKNTIIILTSEHGDLIGEKGRFMRTDIIGAFQDIVLNIPLIIKHPSIDKKREIKGLVQSIDIMPSILKLLNIYYDKNSLQGESIIPLIVDNKKINDFVYAGLVYKGSKDSKFFNNIRISSMIRNLNYKLIHYQIFDLESLESLKNSYEFYDIDKDFNELNNNWTKIDFSKKGQELEKKLFIIENKIKEIFSL